jgi:predicted nucleic acid-binding protein
VKRVTADSNVYVSALIWGGKPLRILEAALQGEIELAISPAIVNETIRVLQEKFNFSADELSKSEGYMRQCARLVEPTEPLN